MKDYSLKINGNQYDISIEDVNEESTMANVTVNGVAYEVEIVGEQASNCLLYTSPSPRDA